VPFRTMLTPSAGNALGCELAPDARRNARRQWNKEQQNLLPRSGYDCEGQSAVFSNTIHAVGKRPTPVVVTIELSFRLK
jgi:hypothetical protein